MNVALHAVWDAFLRPLLQRPKKLQVAALCRRGSGAEREYLLITSRDTGRWIIPKGWPIRGLNSNETALQEAWEEAGVKNSCASSAPVGRYTYNKRRASGLEVPVETLVYSVDVRDLAAEFPEAGERKRKWVKASDAAKMVNEPELKTIFHNCAKNAGGADLPG
ncbi:NUDIX hydrolase [Sulfitobacter sp. F26169L]|uniref:NUDIX hydrolase n=1 Tax=Sulfitobacter sp. F26169L TaxID=2996015 RepID=UPI00226083C1|nr:NUDIX hydrolase [Sulfitobacter sp. F26169L]MCX7564889.1 NUDIX hydrolase [Sulfitobacter sp. F26169L]